MTREAFETALAAGTLQTAVRSRTEVKWYTCRRNGRTKTWKTDPARFEIPVAFRWRDTFRVQDRHFNNGCVDEWFRITQENTNA